MYLKKRMLVINLSRYCRLFGACIEDEFTG